MSNGPFQYLANHPPFVIMEAPPQQPQVSGDTPPARVQVALAYIQALHMKQSPRAAVGPMGIEILDIPKLHQSEENALGAACSLLIDYFRGNVQPNVWERSYLDRLTVAHEQAMVVSCPTCGDANPARQDCKYCRGRGKLLFHPIHGNQSS